MCVRTRRPQHASMLTADPSTCQKTTYVHGRLHAATLQCSDSCTLPAHSGRTGTRLQEPLPPWGPPSSYLYLRTLRRVGLPGSITTRRRGSAHFSLRIPVCGLSVSSPRISSPRYVLPPPKESRTVHQVSVAGMLPRPESKCRLVRVTRLAPGTPGDPWLLGTRLCSATRHLS